jgi:protein-S-isoprenylcysteine O-methyltransferase Ste14
MAAMFVFLHIPALDRYLKERYGAEYVDWTRRSKKLVPFLY